MTCENATGHCCSLIRFSLPAMDGAALASCRRLAGLCTAKFRRCRRDYNGRDTGICEFAVERAVERLKKPASPPLATGPPTGCYLVMVTGVPVETDLKKFSAMNSGMRMQPWDAG